VSRADGYHKQGQRGTDREYRRRYKETLTREVETGTDNQARGKQHRNKRTTKIKRKTKTIQIKHVGNRISDKT